jgi:hypothetical protein
MRYLSIVLFLCSFAAAQDAVVVELPKTDAVTAKTLYDAKVAADKAWENFNSKIVNTYKGSTYFYYGVDFSKDFRFIVPQKAPAATWNSSCVTVAPAIGTQILGGDLTIPNR